MFKTLWQKKDHLKIGAIQKQDVRGFQAEKDSHITGNSALKILQTSANNNRIYKKFFY